MAVCQGKMHRHFLTRLHGKGQQKRVCQGEPGTPTYIYSKQARCLQTNQAVLFSIQQALENAFLADVANPFGGNTQGNPRVFFGDIKLLDLQIGIEFATGLDVRVRNIVSTHYFLSGYFTNFRHDCKYFNCAAFAGARCGLPPKMECKGRYFFSNNQTNFQNPVSLSLRASPPKTAWSRRAMLKQRNAWHGARLSLSLTVVEDSLVSAMLKQRNAWHGARLSLSLTVVEDSLVSAMLKQRNAWHGARLSLSLQVE